MRVAISGRGRENSPAGRFPQVRNLVTALKVRRTIRHPLADGNPPSWASGWGQDWYGVFVDFSLLDDTGRRVGQRMRWIPPGSFRMGSPEKETGRYEDEGPVHDVTISRGFWLFDTPCSQRLWKAVMGDNPSQFSDDERPVENVSWYDCQEFIQRLAGRIAGLDLMLPSEAQWEYACRAGKQTAIYAGDLVIYGKNNAPLLDDIAWYGGNSGVEFDLDHGHDSTEWPQKQFPHTRAGTRKVGRKTPNRWGLYDMLGNVREWCRDGRREYTAESVTDPEGPTDEGAFRVLRGGCWFAHALHVRAASRFWAVPGYRAGLFGFRCARVQDEQDK